MRHQYRPDIDGLRAIAVSSVVLFHAGIPTFRSGFVGVDIFFVISGYLIGGIIISEIQNKKFQFANFYARRARRILPALIAVVLTSCLLGWILLDAGEFFFLGGTALAALLGLSNFSFWRLQDYFHRDAELHPMLMTWSLGVEEQFYALFPILIIVIMVVARKRLLVALAGLTMISFVCAVILTRSYPAAAFYLLPARAWELGVGTILAAWHATRMPWRPSCLGQETIAVAGLLLLAIGIFAFDSDTAFPGVAAAVPVLGTAALITTQGSWVNQRLLSWRPIVFIGLVSYSWYLWHWPLMSYLRIILPSPPTHWQLSFFAAFSFGIAILSWKYIEQPFRLSKAAASQTLLHYAAVVALVLSIPASIKLTNGFPYRMTDETKTIQAAVAARLNASCSAAWDEVVPTRSPECVRDIKNRRAVGLLGDSHAWALSPGLRDATARENVGFRIFTKPGCPPLLTVSVKDARQPHLTEACTEFMANATAALAADERVSVVVLAGRWDNPMDRYVDPKINGTQPSPEILLNQGLEAMIATLLSSGKEVVLARDVPHWSFDPSKAMLADSIPFRRKVVCLFWSSCSDISGSGISISHLTPVNSHSVHIVQRLAEGAGRHVRYIDLFSRFCDAKECKFKDGSEPLYIDRDHLSALGARHALADFSLLFKE